MVQIEIYLSAKMFLENLYLQIERQLLRRKLGNLFQLSEVQRLILQIRIQLLQHRNYRNHRNDQLAPLRQDTLSALFADSPRGAIFRQ